MEYELDNRHQPAKYDCLLFDLDDTLYPLSSGIASHCSKNIQEYMIHQLGIEESKVPDMCYVLYKYYGTTMAGLRAIGYNFDYDHYHRLVHGKLPYDFLKPDPVLRNLLLSLPIRKMIFTNSDERHAAEVLRRLGLEDCFERIICFETLNPSEKGKVAVSGDEENAPDEIFDIMEYQPSSGVTLPPTPVVCKPFETAFEQSFKIAEIDPKRTLFFDDSVRNVSAGKNLGLHTVLVGKSERSAGADYALESIHNIKEAFPELLDAEERLENVGYAQKIAVEA
ncbi:hypothetical protein SOVF_030060 [Spinacia oleracea]|uniref:Suppressor of disruption of TFIIS n=1 Tax=Spinacia oleracea TaxID=3562 RepID=A0A9R0J5K5_SPIOL|nr:suppressor of disruption of TFIIS-like [Spinacia oleracea]KNA22854.1 hypothetical protein SOVF_030060 [Spinacia oleracea]